MADDTNNWRENPIVAAWVRSVEGKGGHVALTGYPYAPFKGAPTAFYDEGPAGDPTVNWAARRYELAPMAVRAAVGFEATADKITIAAGKVLDTVDEVTEGLGLDKGVSGVLGKVLGIPRPVIIGGVILAGALAGYALLVNVGALPPLKKWAQ